MSELTGLAGKLPDGVACEGGILWFVVKKVPEELFLFWCLKILCKTRRCFLSCYFPLPSPPLLPPLLFQFLYKSLHVVLTQHRSSCSQYILDEPTSALHLRSKRGKASKLRGDRRRQPRSRLDKPHR